MFLPLPVTHLPVVPETAVRLWQIWASLVLCWRSRLLFQSIPLVFQCCMCGNHGIKTWDFFPKGSALLTDTAFRCVHKLCSVTRSCPSERSPLYHFILALLTPSLKGQSASSGERSYLWWVPAAGWRFDFFLLGGALDLSDDPYYWQLYWASQ